MTVNHSYTPDLFHYRVPMTPGAPVYAQRDRAVKSMILDLLAMDKTAVRITWFINTDPLDQYARRYMQLDAVVTDLYIEQA